MFMPFTSSQKYAFSRLLSFLHNSSSFYTLFSKKRASRKRYTWLFIRKQLFEGMFVQQSEDFL
ncbi:hypothetical protein C6W20_05890 [Bacillus sp. NMCN6]|nr:hypothetical protein DKE43_06470 [Bacillus pumilus]PRR92991.1 hypothetical protein C6W21_06285 [Bacillus sp. NMCN1]PRS00543.1 hypothetical protein C6W20_05890 [Bacillus sp. NMCN6]PRS50542.1 hypothetical protein C6Y00_10570 [Bacillus sp. GBSC66]PRS61457.1 hypothetical protein C6344_06120 [Bacillus sp. GBSW19]PRS74544.1 hypothetical protein C6Y03_09210 [Bacillus sp. LNXM65]PRS75001.1 hypothetical protein C6Y04_13165 [Bacillus sp. GBSW2]PRS88420.1 hypothetical protein C6348_05880 [Bacillus s